MPAPILSDRVLNRSLLARQLLLDRAGLEVVDAVEHLVGMQAQSPNAPYLGLWSRLTDFAIADLSAALTDRRVVRASLMRGTIHLVSARDCLTLGQHFSTVLAGAVRNLFTGPPGEQQAARLDDVLAAASALLEERPRSLAELRELLGERLPNGDPEAMARAARHLLALVHVPPKGIWGASGQARLTTVRAWLGEDVDRASRIDDVVLRYLAGFGPASIKDMQTWCGLTGLREVVGRLANDLREFRDESGNVLFDLPGAPFPDPDTPVAVRLLPEYDNCLRSHTDRRRVMTAHSRAALFASKNDAPMPAFLVDGFVRGTWKLRRTRGSISAAVRPFDRLADADTAAVAEEARRLLAFVAPEAEEHPIVFE